MARSVSPAPIERRNSSAWSPKQYTKVLTCFSSDSSDSPEANRNWSKHLLYFVHSSGAWRLNDPGGWRVAVTVAITSRQHCCHHVVCELRTWGIRRIVFLRGSESPVSIILKYWTRNNSNWHAHTEQSILQQVCYMNTWLYTQYNNDRHCSQVHIIHKGQLIVQQSAATHLYLHFLHMVTISKYHLHLYRLLGAVILNLGMWLASINT